jgi:hypothetical protein
MKRVELLASFLCLISSVAMSAENYHGLSSTQFDSTCSENNILDIKLSEDIAMKMVDDWRNELVRRNLVQADSNSFGNDMPAQSKSEAEKAYETLSCIRERMIEGLTYVCTPSNEYAGQTRAYVGRTVNLSSDHTLKTYPLKSIAGVLLHEASHKCGTTDAAYFRPTHTKPHSTWRAGWAYIASTYDYWADEGFCIPSVDC